MKNISIEGEVFIMVNSHHLGEYEVNIYKYSMVIKQLNTKYK